MMRTKDRYEAVRSLRRKRSFDAAEYGRPITNEDINRAVAERTYDRDHDWFDR
ncbi:MAG: hypothetical protein OXG74_19535 [Acidobacteria bacterium]|nr:hypothetical protein [Acidobacteriota bacterium]